MSKLKEINDEEISQLHSQINMLRDSLISKEQEFRDIKANSVVFVSNWYDTDLNPASVQAFILLLT